MEEKHSSIFGDFIFDLIVVIPSCGESEFISKCINSLQQCKNTDYLVLILVVVNDGYLSDSETEKSNIETIEYLKGIKANNANIHFGHIYQNEVNGVGMARRFGMDLAAEYYQKNGKNGLIVCLDADCEVDSNYFESICDGFKKFPKKLAASIRFEHPLDNENIILYELHLRYYIDIQRRIKLPFAIQTVGSAMAVRSEDYIKQGRMNKRQAGEDFYFLQKFISIDKCFEINDTRVLPSSRKSKRVPFGTGKAIIDIENNQGEYQSYDPKSFFEIKHFISHIFDNRENVRDIKSHNEKVLEFFENENYKEKWREINKHTSSEEMFEKRFYQWFNAFKLMKCLHYLDSRVSVVEASKQYLSNEYKVDISDPKEMLLWYREKAYS